MEPASLTTTTMPPHAVAQPKVHLHVHVEDLAGAVAFYRTLFGEGPAKERPGYAKFLPAWAPVNLAISEQVLVVGGSVSHVGIQLGDYASVRHHLERVQAAGLQVRVEMGVDCCYANQDKFWVRDPSGLEWEIYVLNHDVEQISRAATPAATSSCCAPGRCAP